VVSTETTYMGVGDVARLLHVPASTVHHWVATCQAPPSFKIGKHRRFERNDVLAWIEKHKEGAR
jgi:excisionase family DNA binding protein